MPYYIRAWVFQWSQGYQIQCHSTYSKDSWTTLGWSSSAATCGQVGHAPADSAAAGKKQRSKRTHNWPLNGNHHGTERHQVQFYFTRTNSRREPHKIRIRHPNGSWQRSGPSCHFKHQENVMHVGRFGCAGAPRLSGPANIAIIQRPFMLPQRLQRVQWRLQGWLQD